MDDALSIAGGLSVDGTRDEGDVRPIAVSLFTGAGGFDQGLEAAGFDLRACVEIDADARSALKSLRPRWPVTKIGDICKLAPGALAEFAQVKPMELDLLVGGPPCQPFSHASAWRRKPDGLRDPRVEPFRRMFVLAEALRPRVMLIENVPALAGGTVRAAVEGWFVALNEGAKTNYRPTFVALNAADYGVPQSRSRLFVIAERDGLSFVTPTQTHYAAEGVPPGAEAHRTAWDAIGGLDDVEYSEQLRCGGRWAPLLPSIPEGHNYYHHTSMGKGLPIFGYRTRYWSFLLKLAKNRPSWTLPATPGPATGPFHWRNRQLSIAEVAALQTIRWSDDMDLPYRTQRRLLGNAVPGAMGELLGRSLLNQWFDRPWKEALTLIPPRRQDCPSPEVPAKVPKSLRPSGTVPAAHPGAGLGPKPWGS